MVNGRIHYSQVAVTDDAGTLRVERPDYELELMRLQHDHQSRSLQGITRWVAFRVDMVRVRFLRQHRPHLDDWHID